MTMMLEQQPLRKKIKIENYSVDTFTSRHIPDDLLHEILIRLPNLGSAIRCSTVCKRWLSIVSRPDFIATFMDHHRSKVDLTLLFGDYFIFGSPIHISLPQRTTTL
ncbi:F-box domain containing protein [Parasponia andersonii]|uniref:F-box domain containing protein n=1 Tax=Parasponia andersonii TaxID=3476 RepID=A0A2P5D858_PARAD|nr:F-box domain containing protein [Parasponia andersonii]